MDPQLIALVMPLGVGGVIAIIVIMWKRSDDKIHAEALESLNRKYAEDVASMVARLEARDDRMLSIVTANTEVLRGLMSAVAVLSDLSKLESKFLEARGDHRRQPGG